jgi:hypothetical protein
MQAKVESDKKAAEEERERKLKQEALDRQRALGERFAQRRKLLLGLGLTENMAGFNYNNKADITRDDVMNLDEHKFSEDFEELGTLILEFKKEEEDERQAKIEKAKEEARLELLAKQKKEKEAELLKAAIERKEQERLAALQPDKEKLKVLSAAFNAIQYPEVSSESASKIIVDTKILVSKIQKHILDNIDKL